MQLRPARPEELERIVGIRHRAFTAHAPGSYTPEEVEYLLADLDRAELRSMIAQGRLLVAVVDGQTRASAGWHDGYLRHVYVEPGRERTGIASALVADVERRARSAGILQLRVGAVIYARRFYERNGYHVVQLARADDDSVYYEMSKILRGDTPPQTR